MTDLPAAVDAAESTLRNWLEPWLGAVAHGTTLGSQIRRAASLVVRDAAPHLTAAAAAVRLLEEALHLRMHGERAPGGSETWHDWDTRTEAFLRSLHGGDHD